MNTQGAAPTTPPAGGTPGAGSFLNSPGTPPAGTPPAAASGGTPPPAGNPPALPYPEGDWRNSLPEEIRAEPSLKIMNDPASLAKSYISAQKMLGSDKVSVPSKHWSEQDWQEFYTKTGLVPPEDKYEVQLPKEAKWVDPKWVDELKPIARKFGVQPKALEKIAEWYEGKSAAGAKAISDAKEQETKAGFEALKQEWGKAFDQKGAFAKRLIHEHADDSFKQWMEESGMGNNAQFIKLTSKLGEMLYKEDAITQGGPSGNAVYSPSEALKKANEILADVNHPYNKNDHPNHVAAVREVEELFGMAYPKAT